MTKILGLSAFFHDSAACLVVDGEIVAAAQEERFTRQKHDPEFPLHAARYCLAEAGIEVEDLDYVGFYEKPLLKFDRLLETYLDFAPRGFPSFLKALPGWMKEKLWLPDVLRQGLARVEGFDDEREAKKRARQYRFPVLFGDHHESHAASAFYPSPFEEAAILTADGVGEWATSSIGMGRGASLELLEETRFPSSLGLLYSAFTYYTGFRVNSGEYKVMGLAPYGEPRFVDEIRRVVEIAADGSFRLDQRYFDYCSGLRMTNRRFHDLFGGPPREPESRVTQREMDLARSVQVVTEEILERMAAHAQRRTGAKYLCLAGGVALNCVANGRILRDGPFEDLWIQPAAGDAGGALGVALAIWHRFLDQPRTSAESAGLWLPRATASGVAGRYDDGMKGSLLGPRDSEETIDRFLSESALPHRALSRDELSIEVARLLADGKVVGFHQGRMEFGPRALGARSILGDPRSPAMQSVMNLKIKFRESFRPFAPCVLREEVANWFELGDRCHESPYMLIVAPVAERRRLPVPAGKEKAEGIEKLQIPRSEIPAVTHVDLSARVQTVRATTHPELAGVLREFQRLTGCPVLVNTSFNVRGEPIVCTPADSYRCFMRTEIDALALETRLLIKSEQPPFAETGDWQHEFALD